jgi:hypothetical protein
MAGDQKTGDDEEDVDADVPTGQGLRFEVEDDH